MAWNFTGRGLVRRNVHPALDDRETRRVGVVDQQLNVDAPGGVADDVDDAGKEGLKAGALALGCVKLVDADDGHAECYLVGVRDPTTAEAIRFCRTRSVAHAPPIQRAQ